KRKINLMKTSDRRLASGRAASSYLLSNDSALPAVGGKDGKNSRSNRSNRNSKNSSKRRKGSRQWVDESMEEWDSSHFRMFVGNLGPDATEQMVQMAFGKFLSLAKVKVPVDRRTGQNKGYGFVSFASADDCLAAFKEMNGKYIGQHPVQLKRA
ncbi:RNA-binding domain-containing protein, partial [Ascoidea rubescens DSM 1968]